MSTLNGLALDIDDTLCDTARVCMEVIHQEYPVSGPFDTDRFLQKYGQPAMVPEWQTSVTQERICQLLSDDLFLLSVPPISDALAHFHQVDQLLPVAFYLTSRVHDRRTVTEQWLKLHGFPARPIITRDPLVMDPSWKVQLLGGRFPEIWGLIDNEIHVPIPHTFKGNLLQLSPYPPSKTETSVTYFQNWAELKKFLEKELEEE